MRENSRVLIVAIVFLVLSAISLAALDTSVATSVRDFHRSWTPTYIFYYFTLVPIIQFFGGGVTVAVSGGLLILLARVFNRALYKPAVAILAAYAVSGLVAQALKHLFGRARPRITEELLFAGPSLRGGFDSFPSGHTIVVFCIASVLARLYPKWSVVWFAYALVIACERVLSFTHFLGDVLAGVAVGITTGIFLVIPLLKTPFMEGIMSKPDSAGSGTINTRDEQRSIGKRKG